MEPDGAAVSAHEPKVDAHCHVLDPSRFPYADDVAYRPTGAEIGPLENYLAVMAAYGIRHALFVGPNSGYNLDNRCLLDALARGHPRFRGIAVLRNEASRDELLALRAAGVIGVAFNATVQGVPHVLAGEALMARCAELDLLVQVQAEHEQWVLLEPLLARCQARVMIDHCGRPRAGAGLEQPGFQAVLRLARGPLRDGRTAIKLSGYQKFSTQPPPWTDAWPFVDALLGAYGLDHAMWASDWPFLRATQRLDVGPLLRIVEHLLPDACDRRRLWWDTPRRWFDIKDLQPSDAASAAGG
jgi:predicted TIM-barrel fold metal-dependent hydrolase